MERFSQGHDVGRCGDPCQASLRERANAIPGTPDSHHFIELIKILGTVDYCSKEIRVELARTPAMQKRMKKVGFIPFERNDPDRICSEGSEQILEKFGIEIPKPAKSKPRLPKLPQGQAEEVTVGR